MIAAPGEKLCRVAKSTATDAFNAFGLESSIDQLAAVFHSQAEIPGLRHAELPRDIDADFITALADTWSDGSENSRRVRSKFPLHSRE